MGMSWAMGVMGYFRHVGRGVLCGHTAGRDGERGDVLWWCGRQ